VRPDDSPLPAVAREPDPDPIPASPAAATSPQRGPGDTLTEYTRQLHDAPSMRRVLEAALCRLTGMPISVQAHEIDYFRLKPECYINAAFEISGICRPTGRSSRWRVSCTIWPSLEGAKRQYDTERCRLGDGVFAGASRLSSQSPITLVPEMAMVAWLFPADPALTGLMRATNVDRMMSLMARHLPECRDDGWHPVGLDCKVIRYRPRRRCTLLYTVRLEHRRRSATLTREAFGKVFPDDRWQAWYAVQEAVWQAARASNAEWRAARPIGCVPEWRFVLQEALRGRAFRHAFANFGHDAANEPQLTESEEHLRVVARAVRAMQLAPIPSSRRGDFDSLLTLQATNLAALHQSQPTLARELARLREEVTKLSKAIKQQPLGFSHGDFAHKNVLLDEEGLGIVDFDRAGHAEPAYDVAYFLTRLSGFLTRVGSQERAAHLSEAFRTAYLELAPEVSRERLALYEALDRSAYVLQKVHKQNYQTNWLQWARGQTALAWERISDATGTRDRR
jgi:aminoglycoside phosphotransferase (APT) family kinase protein